MVTCIRAALYVVSGGLRAQMSEGISGNQVATHLCGLAGDSSVTYLAGNSWGIGGIYVATRLCVCAGDPSSYSIVKRS